MFDLSFISVIYFFLESPRQGYAVRTDGGIVAQRRPPIPIDSRKPESLGARGYNMYIYIYIYMFFFLYHFQCARAL